MRAVELKVTKNTNTNTNADPNADKNTNTKTNMDEVVIGWEIPRESLEEYAISSELNGETTMVMGKGTIGVNEGSTSMPVSSCGQWKFKLMSNNDVIREVPMTINPAGE